MTGQDSTNLSSTEKSTPSFSLQRVYLKDLSLEMPNAPHIFLEQGVPKVEVKLHLADQCLTNTMFESTISITITTRIEDRTVYLVEGTQAGIFEITNVSENQLGTLLNVVCPNILHSYLRANLADAITRTSLPPVHLAEVNFQAMYEKRNAEKAQEKQQ